MKFSSHPFCVSEGIPVRQEVPSRNRRKREETAERKGRREGRDRRKEREDANRKENEREDERATVVDTVVERQRTRGLLRDIVQGEGVVFAAGRLPSRARKLSAELRLYRRSQREGTPSTRENLLDVW